MPGVGEVRLDLSRNATSSRTAAATALELTVSVNPLKLGVADVEGTLTLAKATCEAPAAPAASQSPADEVEPQGGPVEEAGLAETGGSSVTPYLLGGALALLVAGAGAVVVARRRG